MDEDMQEFLRRFFGLPAPSPNAPRQAATVFVDGVQHYIAEELTWQYDLDDEACSGLSPYLHFGHVSVHDVFARVAKRLAYPAT